MKKEYLDQICTNCGAMKLKKQGGCKVCDECGYQYC